MEAVDASHRHRFDGGGREEEEEEEEEKTAKARFEARLRAALEPVLNAAALRGLVIGLFEHETEG